MLSIFEHLQQHRLNYIWRINYIMNYIVLIIYKLLNGILLITSKFKKQSKKAQKVQQGFIAINVQVAPFVQMLK